MNRPILVLFCAVGFFACDGCQGGPTPPADAGCTDGGPGCPITPPSACDSGFCIQVVDSTSTELQQLAIAVQADDAVSIAYINKTGEYNELDAGNAFGSLYSIEYAEWKAGTITSPIHLPTAFDAGVAFDAALKRAAGIALALQPNGQPAVAFLGGDDETQAFWFQHESFLDQRGPSGTWTPFSVAQSAVQVTDIPDERIGGFLVGLYPALAFDSTQGYLAYRDCHNGETSTDWEGSDIQVGTGSGSSWPLMVTDSLDTYGKNGDGNHSQMLVVNGQAVLFYDRNTQSIGNDVTDQSAHDLIMQFRNNADGTWTPPNLFTHIGDTQLGPSVAYDPTLGYVIAVYDQSSNPLTGNNLNYLTSTNNGVNWTNPPNAVFGGASGGWWPSLAIDPVAHVPHIAYHYCGVTVGLNPGSCPTNEQALRVTYLGPDRAWHFQSVDPEGGFVPKLAFLSTGKRVIVYRVPQGPNVGNLKIAVEQ